MKLGAFPPQSAFLPALAKLWLESGGAPEDGLLILPTRRAAKTLAGAFLEQNGGKALLLPRIIAPAALDEAGLILAGGLDVPPPITPIERQAILARLILRQAERVDRPTHLPAAWALAADLAALLDEADHAEIDLGKTLPNLVEGELAAHWQTTLEFLKIITLHWPAILQTMGRQNPVARQIALIDAQTAFWAANPPNHRIWMAASSATPALARLARVVAGLPQGMLIFPGYDPELSDAAWAALEASHAQSGIAKLLGAIGARREEILPLPAPFSPVPAGRAQLLSRALLPAAELGDWQKKLPQNVDGLQKLQTQDEADNALAIAMILRDALEIPGRTAALITPDRALATRVGAALKRFGITADDSAGENLANTPPATILRLLARAAMAEYAPLPLLSLLKHPLVAAGLPLGRAREFARSLEILALRGPRPEPGFRGIRFRVDAKHTAEHGFLDRLEVLLRPLALPVRVNPAAALRALLQAGENLCATAQETGAEILWRGEAGIAVSELLLESLEALQTLPDMAPAILPELLDALLQGAVLRRPRTKDGHPRIAIWGIQEAAMQSVDVAVLGGLVEGVWPAQADPGPWASRPMRAKAGLPAPEQKIGEAASAFFALACACPVTILAAPARRERAPAIPARWLTRMDAFCAGAQTALENHPAASWAAQLDQPVAREARPKPRPCPPLETRPKKLTISEITTLLADPYAIYARKILQIRELDRLDAESDAGIFGDIVHAGLAEFFSDPEALEQPEAAARLSTILHQKMLKLRPRAALENWWAARLERIAAWIVQTEVFSRMTQGKPLAMAHELQSELELPGGFTLIGRADRIERKQHGNVAILDYKTGAQPNAKQVESGAAPQLPLEAVMAESGAFGEAFAAMVTELTYLKLSGRAEPGSETRLFVKKPEILRLVIDNAEWALPRIFAKFADPATPYLASPHPSRPNKYDAYAGISRRAEWAGEDENDGD